MKLEIKKLNTFKPQNSLPFKASSNSSGFDVSANLEQTIAILPNSRLKIPTGLAFNIPTGYEIQVRPRSGLSLNGLSAIFGTIDSDYTGELFIIMHNLTDRLLTINNGDRIAQLVVNKLPEVELIEVDTLKETDRSDSGFGSTGV